MFAKSMKKFESTGKYRRKGAIVKIFLNERNSGGIIIFFNKNQKDGRLRDLYIMLANATENRSHIAIWEEDVLA